MRVEMLNCLLRCRFRHRSADDDLSAGEHEKRDVKLRRSLDQSGKLFRFLLGVVQSDFED